MRHKLRERLDFSGNINNNKEKYIPRVQVQSFKREIFAICLGVLKVLNFESIKIVSIIFGQKFANIPFLIKFYK